jgi:hypothetical protein
MKRYILSAIAIICLLIVWYWGLAVLAALAAGTALGWVLRVTGLGRRLAETIRPLVERAARKWDQWRIRYSDT